MVQRSRITTRYAAACFVAPLICFALAFGAIIATHRTIAPVDIYLVSKQLYQPGNAAKVRNHYLSDIVEVFLPWKYYLSEFHPHACATSLTSGGIELPQGVCYPMSAVHRYIYYDAFFPLRHFFSFFASYDLSYWLSLSFIYAAFFSLFFSWIRNFSLNRRLEVSAPAAIVMASGLAAVCATGFSVARDLQYDGLSQGLPFLLLSMACLTKSEGSMPARMKSRAMSPRNWLLLSFVLLFLSLTRTSLQNLGFAPLMWFCFWAVWLRFFFEKKGRSRTALVLAGLAVTVLAGCFYHYSAIRIFLSGTQNFIPQKNLSFSAVVVKRVAAIGLELWHFFLGAFLFSFDTIDFSKALGSLGSREYVSYDNMTVFLQPAIGFFVLALLVSLGAKSSAAFKRAAKALGLAFLVNFLVIESPLYRLLYFRFNQWWLLLSVGLFLCAAIAAGAHQEIRWRKATLAAVGVILPLLILFAFVLTRQSYLLQKFGTSGQLGFENGIWQERLTHWLRRIEFRDVYAVIFAASVFAVGLFARRRAWISLVAALTCSGLFLNIFFYNRPQSRGPFYEFKTALTEGAVSPLGLNMPENVNLFLNRPVTSIYESLQIPVKTQ